MGAIQQYYSTGNATNIQVVVGSTMMDDCTDNKYNDSYSSTLSYSIDEELPALLSDDEAQVNETESSGDGGLPALEYGGPSPPSLHSPIVSNDRAGMLAVPFVTQYPEDVPIFGWGHLMK